MNFKHSALIRALVLVLLSRVTSAEPATFDLAGPIIEVEITRGARSLPISQVPNLAIGDRVQIKADLPPGQSAHYLMVATFLRGATNPPPIEWFSRCETWTSRCIKEGLSLTVPESAQQLIIFLAPQTGGDFRTLANAVRGRPGAFVRTSQDLIQATLDRSRLDAYLTAVRGLGDVDPSQLKAAAPLLARSLAIKVDEKCLGKIPVLQAPCLAQGRDSLILDDGHSVSIAQQLTSGPASDLAMEASSTPLLRSGYYGPFIGSIFDIAKILDSFHTAQYQYFPALTSTHGRRLALTLNAPPSFHDPKSVLVVALPAIEGPQLPPLHAVNPEETLCARRDRWSSRLRGLHWFFPRSTRTSGRCTSITRTDHHLMCRPARILGVAVSLWKHTNWPERSQSLAKASLRAKWGFDDFEGPSFKFADPGRQAWSLGTGDAAGLIVGRPDIIHLHADSVSCLETVMLVSPEKQWTVEWKRTSPREVEAKLPLQEGSPGEMTLLIKQFGAREPQRLSSTHLRRQDTLSASPSTRETARAFCSGIGSTKSRTSRSKTRNFLPNRLSTHDGQDELSLLADAGRSIHAPRPGDTTKATVALKDGRALEVKVSVDSPRPSAVLISKSMTLPDAAELSDIHLSDEGELPLQGELTFSLRAQSPSLFTHEDKLEVATTDGESSVILGVASGGLMLQSAKVAVATLDPQKAFGISAFGPLRFRRVVDGVSGDWRPLATLVRIPRLTGVDCPAALEADCTLTGANLFLLDSISRDAAFTQPTHIPEGFTDQGVAIPHVTDGHLYIRLRDDASIVSAVLLSVRVEPSPSAGTAGGLATAQGDVQPSAADTKDSQPAVAVGGSGENITAVSTSNAHETSGSQSLKTAGNERP